MKLSILCVTRGEPYSVPFLFAMSDLAAKTDAELVVALDGVGFGNEPVIRELAHRLLPIHAKGYLESVLDQAVAHCTGNFILRLDDDEKASPAMVDWLVSGAYQANKHWKFPRAHLWGNPKTMILNGPLWPDHQTRLSHSTMAGGRGVIHAGSPHGGGEMAPVVIEHHKFLVKSFEERQAIAQRYDGIMAGAGTGGFLAFNLPERAFPFLHLAEYLQGHAPV